ncbi:MAG: hypothetical protein MPK07_01080 [Alphaproteobacteria bacterium]|nr:hypothetical protein [Alphaproteobacteria bacterium]MDA8012512.1 hypothetical protein [Alphaproteobacteria bacterium]
MSKSALIATLIAALKPRPAEEPSPRRPMRHLSEEEEQERSRRARKEVDDNARVFFDELLDGLIADGHKGKSALMRDGKVVEILDNYRAAKTRGLELFPGIDEFFSIQEITDEPWDIGTLGAWVVASDDKKPAAT